MVLIIDVGNTRVKSAVYECFECLYFDVFDKSELQKKFLEIFNNFSKVNDLVIASVTQIPEIAFFEFENKVKMHFVSNKTVFPFRNLYQTPQTLGVDRMVLASGAVFNYPKQNRLVIDAGTCVTYDFVDADDQYLGGAISPGIQLRYKSLHQFTNKLPLLGQDFDYKENEMVINQVGTNTKMAIHSGVVNGLVHEIEGFIDSYQSEYSKIIIILTGGDAEFLAKRLKNTIFANSNFLLESLNQLFQHQIKND